MHYLGLAGVALYVDHKLEMSENIHWTASQSAFLLPIHMMSTSLLIAAPIKLLLKSNIHPFKLSIKPHSQKIYSNLVLKRTSNLD